jgi:protein tyrosine phosphatase
MAFLLIADDDTRVTLNLIDGDPNSHYINASFIKVHKFRDQK